MDIDKTYDVTFAEPNLQDLTSNVIEAYRTHPTLPVSDKVKEEANYQTISTSYAWKIKDSFPSKVISITEDIVVLEIVKDRENGITEERGIPLSFFAGFLLEVGAYFKLQIYERPNAQMFQVSLGTFVTQEDFPAIDFQKFMKKSFFEQS